MLSRRALDAVRALGCCCETCNRASETSRDLKSSPARDHKCDCSLLQFPFECVARRLPLPWLRVFHFLMLPHGLQKSVVFYNACAFPRDLLIFTQRMRVHSVHKSVLCENLREFKPLRAFL